MQHRVQQGDYLAKIARVYGLSDWREIWNHPDNLALKNRRKDPNVLFPGDVLAIPDTQAKHVARPADQSHRFTAKRPDLRLIVVLDRAYDTPLAGIGCELTVDGDPRLLTSGGDGRIERGIAPVAAQAQLTLRDSGTALDHVPVTLRIGHLDPVDLPSGQCARLNNLAYFAGPDPDGDAGENARLFDSAVQEFQCDHGLVVDGVCGPRTQSKLREVYGC
ncbi:MAG: PGRP and LysM peptidoglycan-binding domain-containing protein [Lysobacter sp.]